MTGGRGVDFAPYAPHENVFDGRGRGCGRAQRDGQGGTVRVKSLRLLSSVLLVGLSVSGCAVLGGGPPPLDTYELTAPATHTKARARRVQVLIAEPTALKPLDGENIVVRPAPGQVQYLKGAQWSDRLPKIVQARLAQTFQSSGAFGGVGKPGEGLAIDYQITTEIRAFDIRVSGGDRAQVELFARVLDDRNGVVRAAKVFSASAPVSGSGNDAYAAALDAAFGSVAAEIVSWADGLI
ncbi:MAG: membrane integrity-associated transporter subunit PqiC [Rhizobiaceae bacterium]|nr:membrane integrity-associated transporter subunit PqiC [Rhizobiaceae bacterium]